MPFSVHLLAHTHWDREWYQPFARFRQRLVALVDELLDDPPTGPESFLLDGQAIVLEDYLAVRPERAAELAKVLQRGHLEAGPWYVLADELIPSGESLVRNLLVGRRVLRALRADPPPVLYCPDSFGHPASLPALARGFGFSLVILWRGFGGRRWPSGDVFDWRAPDGETVIAFHLPRDGYEYASHLPIDDDAARERWRRVREELGSRSTTGALLLQNGADHHARQLEQRRAFSAMITAAATTGDTARGSSLRGFANELIARVEHARIPAVQGELRDSYGYTWTLQGTFGSRAAQKRRAAIVERLLTRDAEPWAAIARRRGAPSRLALLVAAWKSLLQTHPHDTLCGCSIDAVADAMDLRLREAFIQGAGIRDDALANVIGHDPVAARVARQNWIPSVVVRNRAGRPRGGVAMLDIREFIADVPVGPGSAAASSVPAPAPGRRTPSVSGGSKPQLLRQRTDFDRIESPRDYPDNDLVTISRAAVWLDAVPPYGTVSLPIGEREGEPLAIPNPVRAEAASLGTLASLDNGLLRLTVDEQGVLSLTDLAHGQLIPSVLIIEDDRDLGDLYTPSLRGPAASPEFLRARLPRRGPIIGRIATHWRLRDPSAPDRRRGRDATTDLEIVFTLEANAPFVRIGVSGTNARNDHRLRIGVRTLLPAADVWADAAFGAVLRIPLTLPPEDSRMESAPRTAPLHRYVSLFSEHAGATLYSDGLAEYEATPGGDVLITVLRAVGELSRNDLPERPGHAGWPAHTPGAQSHGPFGARLALMLHGPRTPDVIDAIERAADDVLLPLEGQTLRSALAVPPATSGVELCGAGLALSAIKESEDGQWLVVRCVNLLEEEVEGTWRFGFPVTEAKLTRLDEMPIETMAVTENRVSFRSPPRAIVTVLVR